MNIRSRKDELETVQQTIKFFETLLRASIDGIVITDIAQNIIVVNEAFCDFFGCHRNDVVETNLLVWLEQFEGDAQQRWADVEKRVRREGVCHDVEFKLMTMHQNTWLNVNASLLERVADEEMGAIISIWRNITHRKQTEEELKKYRNHLEELVEQRTAELQQEIAKNKVKEAQLRQARKMESIGTLTGGIAHDFNNILYMIMGNAELALEDIPEWNPVHANLEEIINAGMRAAGIVKQLLNFSRKADQELKPIDAITVIKDALKFLRSTIPASIEIHNHLPVTNATVLADPIQINQVLMNICTNASQAMEEKGGILDITVETTTIGERGIKNYPKLAQGEYIKIVVSDTGPGIDTEIIDRIFDPYFTTKEVGKGSGMGLSTVHGIMVNHNGAITVDSLPGKGATFTMLFPVVTEKPVLEVKKPAEIHRGNEAILFVDDEESIVNMTGQMLERLGYTVETKTNPVDALELFQSKPDQFELVITDMTMPQMTGVKLSEKLMEIRSDIPVIICTGHSPLIDKEKSNALGIAAYIMKPIVKQEIAKTIRMVLDRK